MAPPCTHDQIVQGTGLQCVRGVQISGLSAELGTLFPSALVTMLSTLEGGEVKDILLSGRPTLVWCNGGRPTSVVQWWPSH